MPRLNQPFNPNQHNPRQGDGQLPIGRHLVLNTASAVMGAAGNANNGYIKYIAQIQDGENKGVSGGIIFNVYHESEKAREFSNSRLSAMLHAVGVLVPLEQTEMAHGILYMVEVGPSRDADNAAKGYTEVTHFYLADGTEPSPTNYGPRQPVNGGAAQNTNQNTGFNNQQQNNNGGQQQNNQPQNNGGFNNQNGNQNNGNQNNGYSANNGNNGGNQPQNNQPQNNNGGGDQNWSPNAAGNNAGNNGGNNGGNAKPSWA